MIGEANKGTLFLDEIGEIPIELQGHLLRVLDTGGEYHRLGDSTSRKADVRLVAATNRDATELKHDLVPRFAVRVEVPPISDRIEDIPLIARARLEANARTSPEVVGRFRGDDGEIAIDPKLIEHLVTRPLPGNVRDIEATLWAAMSASRSGVIGPPKDDTGPRPSVSDRDRAAPSNDAPRSVRTKAIDAAAVRNALREAEGNLVRAASSLGLSSRYALYRLIRKFEIDLDEARVLPGPTE
jgi:two-component system nitrogen regulation response regulator GlnG/two-component system response regulator HydG